MTTKIINTKKTKFVIGSSLKNLSAGTAVNGVNSDLLYVVMDNGVCRIVDGYFIPWGNLDPGAYFEVVDIEVHIK